MSKSVYWLAVFMGISLGVNVMSLAIAFQHHDVIGTLLCVFAVSLQAFVAWLISTKPTITFD